jgi:peptide chain release factor 2
MRRPFCVQYVATTVRLWPLVYPEADDNIEIELIDKERRSDTYCASGLVGQHVNKTDSAVRTTQSSHRHRRRRAAERSQHLSEAK